MNRYVYRINIIHTGVVYVFWKKVDGLLRIDIETIQNTTRKRLTGTQIARKDTESPN